MNSSGGGKGGDANGIRNTGAVFSRHLPDSHMAIWRRQAKAITVYLKYTSSKQISAIYNLFE